MTGLGRFRSDSFVAARRGKLPFANFTLLEALDPLRTLNMSGFGQFSFVMREVEPSPFGFLPGPVIGLQMARAPFRYCFWTPQICVPKRYRNGPPWTATRM